MASKKPRPGKKDKTAGEEPKAPGQEEELDEEEELGGRMTFIEHLEELRRRILVCALTFLGCFLVIYGTSIKTIRFYFMLPLTEVLEKMGSTMIYTGIAEGFVFELKLSAVAAIFVSSPMIFYQLWAFIAPGLYKKERLYAGPFIILSTLFFTGGAAFFYFVVFPFVADFFSQFAADQLQWKPKLSEAFSFVVMMMLAFGAVFELPVLTFILAKLGIISSAFLSRNRKYAILIMITLAAFITPPDVVSQLFLFAPMWMLYEFSVLVAWIFGPRVEKEKSE